jgi:tetratricopeptide (TPR) repeat protein
MKQAVQDRTRRSYVYGQMSRAGHWLVCLTFAASLGACGGKDAKKKTTPGSPGSSDPSGMNDKDPDGTGPTGPGDSSGGTGQAGGSGSGTNPGDPGSQAEAPPLPVIPPNFDPDPAEARGAVDQHLKVGRAALLRTPPDPDTALREARLALAIDGANVDAAAMVAHAYFYKRQYDTAELVLDDLFKRDAAKRNPRVLYVYGLVYDKTKRPAEAALAFRQAVDADPAFASALINLGAYQLRNKQYAEASATFERVISLGQNDAVSLTSLGSAYRGQSADYPAGSAEQAQWLSRAEDAYKRALSANRNYGPVYYNLGLLYFDADPFPDPSSGGTLDTLQRLQRAKTYFDEYKNMAGVDIKLYEERMKDVQKAIKREEKRRKQKPA